MEGKVAAITGASSGIGKATALPLHERGAKLVLGARRPDRLAAVAGLVTRPTMSVYSATKFAVRVISKGLRQEAGDKLRVTIITAGFVQTDFADSMTNPEVKAQIPGAMEKLAIPPDAIAHAIAFAIEQPANVDVGEIVVRPTAQG